MGLCLGIYLSPLLRSSSWSGLGLSLGLGIAQGPGPVLVVLVLVLVWVLLFLLFKSLSTVSAVYCLLVYFKSIGGVVQSSKIYDNSCPHFSCQGFLGL